MVTHNTPCFPNSCGLPEPGGPSKHCSVFAVDIAGFGKRDNDVQRAMRHILFASTAAAIGVVTCGKSRALGRGGRGWGLLRRGGVPGDGLAFRRCVCCGQGRAI